MYMMLIAKGPQYLGILPADSAGSIHLTSMASMDNTMAQMAMAQMAHF